MLKMSSFEVEDASLAGSDRLPSPASTPESEQAQAAGAVTKSTDVEEPVPLSYAQERLWFLEQLGGLGSAYNMQLSVRLEGALNVEALELSFAELVRRHESLRTRFGMKNGVPHQLIDPPDHHGLHQVDLGATFDAKERNATLENLIQREQLRVFDLREGRLFRVVLVKLGPHEHALIVTMHHIISDGWTRGILHRELTVLYGSYSQGRPPLLNVPIQYRSFAKWQRESLKGKALQTLVKYWREQLLGASPQLALPTDRPRPGVESFRGAELKFELTPMLYQGVKELSRRKGVTPFMVLLATYQVLLARHSGQQDIVVGVPIAGRAKREFEGIVGCFVNTLVMRTDVSMNLTFSQLLERVKDVTLGAYENQDLPFELLVQELRPERDLTRQPIFQVALVLQNYPEVPFDLPGLTCTKIHSASATTHFDLSLYLYTESDRISAVIEYATDLFDERTIESLAEHYWKLLEGAIVDPDCQIHQLPLLSATEKHKLIYAWNATAVTYTQTSLVHELFERQVELTPEAIAIVFEGRLTTYAELNERANRLARHLRERGVGPDQLVAVCVERSPEMVIGLLGIIKAGGAYLPMDPHYPSERLQYMLEDGAPVVLLTQRTLRSTFTGFADVVELESALDCSDSGNSENLSAAERGLTSAHLLYVIYTSGSTGRPKAIGMPHCSMVNLIEWHRHHLRIEEEQRVLQFAALSFDVAFQEVFSTLCTGGTLVLVDEWTRKDAKQLMALLGKECVARIFVPPLLLQSLAECFNGCGTVPNDLMDVITAGEQLRISQQVVALTKTLQGCRLHNHYGPTETHVVTTATLERDPETWPTFPSIGRPIDNAQIYILDRQCQPVPVGVTGEIYIAGSNLARGYLNQPALTADRFLCNPFSTDRQSRMYRTGDQGRWRWDGTIEYLGRSDDQVKIRGHRIELGEVESQLAHHPQVGDAVVLMREDVPGEKRLVAYFTSHGQAPTPEQLREHLRQLLPDYMVPGAFLLLENLPITPSGKLDRRALPAPDVDAYSSGRYEPPIGELEVGLANIWQELLGVQRVGRHDNFFELGGHSLLAMQVVARIESVLSIEIPVRLLFDFPCLEPLASQLVRRRRARLVERIKNDGMEELLRSVASMSESKVQELLADLDLKGMM